MFKKKLLSTLPLLLFLAACHHRAEANEAKQMDIKLEWSMKHEGGKLRIDYTVVNASNKRIYLLDQLLVARKLEPEAVVVTNGETAGSVVFSRALVKTKEKTLTITLPAARPVEAGQRVSGVGRVPLPIRTWHNYSFVDPLKGTPTSATLVIGYLPDPGAGSFSEEALADGTKISVPNPAAMSQHSQLRSESKPIPQS